MTATHNEPPIEPANEHPDLPPGRWQVLRDMLAFQFKLMVDGVRDLLLSPVSIVAALAGVLFSPDDPGKWFYSTLRAGRRSEEWINLFGAEAHDPDKLSTDTYIRKVEDAIVNEYNKGGVLKKVKDNTDSVLDKLNKSRNIPPD